MSPDHRRQAPAGVVPRMGARLMRRRIHDIPIHGTLIHDTLIHDTPSQRRVIQGVIATLRTPSRWCENRS